MGRHRQSLVEPRLPEEREVPEGGVEEDTGQQHVTCPAPSQNPARHPALFLFALTDVIISPSTTLWGKPPSPPLCPSMTPIDFDVVVMRDRVYGGSHRRVEILSCSR